MTLSIAQRNAASVLPLPVGASTRVASPRAIAGHPCACGGVGAAKEARNHSATAGWNSSRTSARFATELLSNLHARTPSRRQSQGAAGGDGGNGTSSTRRNGETETNGNKLLAVLLRCSVAP